MKNIAKIFTAIVCLLHGYFLLLEMFLWTTPFGLKTFKMTLEVAKNSSVLAANQGFYNGMLAFGLIISFFLKEKTSALAIRWYCLFFIIAAGFYGWYSFNVKIFYIQALPAMIAISADWYSERSRV